MRVALLANYPAEPARIYGGVQAVAFHLVQGLAQCEELDLHVIHCHSEIPADRTVRDGGVTVHYLSRPKRRVIPNSITGIAPLVRTLRSIRPDLANAHGGQYAFAALQAGVPTVYTIHGVADNELRYASGWKHSLELALAAYYDRSAVKRVDDVIAISPFVERQYRGKTRARFHEVDNPVGNEYFEASGTEVPGRVLFAGTIGPRKQPLLLLEALHKVAAAAPEAHVHLAGRSASAAYLRRLQDFVGENRLQARTSVLGPLDAPAMLREYSECALLALPSAVETAPIVILEAMAAGKPIVATRVGGVPDLVEDHVTGFLVAPGDVDSLAERIVRLLKDGNLRACMGGRAREVAARRFQRDKVAARYHEIYRGILRRRKQNPVPAQP